MKTDHLFQLEMMILVLALALPVTRIAAQNWDQVIKAVAADRAEGDNFGYSVAINGNFAIVGAYGNDYDAEGSNMLLASGAAYIFHYNGTTWIQQQKLVAADRAYEDYFGISVAIDGEYAIVGANWQDEDTSGSNTLTNAGAAYIFYYDGTTWTQQAMLTASDRGGDDTFGSSVSLNGDRAIIGAYGHDYDKNGENSLQYAGAAYIFLRSGTTWNQEAKLTASDRASNDYFGYSVAISGDDAVVGAHGNDYDSVGTDYISTAGAAYVFHYDGTNWTEAQKIVAADRHVEDSFGLSVTIYDDYIIAGAYNNCYDDSSGNYVYGSGAAYVFCLNNKNMTWVQQQKLVAGDRGTYDYFGWSVGLCNEYAVIGTYGNNHDAAGENSMANAGAAYVFSRSDTVWTQQQKLVSTDRTTDDRFGWSVSISGENVIAGANREGEDADGQNSLTYAGSAYIFSYGGSAISKGHSRTAAEEFGIHKAYPNPFNPSVTLNYSLTKDANTSLKVYNVLGQEIATLVDAYQNSGNYTCTWQPENLSAGIYLVRLESGNDTKMQKVVFVK